jgi:hypothetical protein
MATERVNKETVAARLHPLYDAAMRRTADPMWAVI